MTEVKFIFKTFPTIIQCQKNTLFKDICKSFSLKSNSNLSELIFLYNGRQINMNLTFEQTASSIDKNDGKMTVLVNPKEEMKSHKPFIEFSKDIICPTCLDNCQIKFNEYKIFLECQNGHKFKEMQFKEFNNSQNVDISKIICEICKINNKSIVYGHKFFKCLSCKKNLCPLCKEKHPNCHAIIDYEQKDFTCFIHNENFTSYCKKCKKNLCIECDSSHEHKDDVILFRDILPKKDIIKSQINDLRIKIEKYQKVIENVKKELDNIIASLRIYYFINYYLVYSYEQKKKNYQIFYNFEEILNNNYIVINDLNNIEYDDDNLFSIFPQTNKIYKKMIKKENNIKTTNNSYEKLIYLSMIAEKAKKYNDMAAFMKEFTIKKNDDLTPNEKNLMTIAFKNSLEMQSIKTILDYEKNEKEKNSPYLSYIIEYRKFILDIYVNKNKEIINILEEHCLPRAKTEESKAFYFKMIGDYYRYGIQLIDLPLKNYYINNCLKNYSEAESILKDFSFINPIKLGLLLNKSVFYYENIEDSKMAIECLKTTIEKFEEEEKNIDKENADYKKSVSIYELLKENLENVKKDNN